MRLRFLDVFLALAGGALLGIGFVAPMFWWTALFGLAPILLALSREGLRKRDAFLLGFLGGFAGYGLSFYTVYWSTLPLTWLGITEAWFAVFAVFLIWFMTAGGFALAIGLFAMLVRWSRLRSWHALLGIPAAWVLADWLGMWVFSIHTLGPNAILGANFSMGSFGYLLADNAALLQGAWLGGIYALNFEVAFFGTLAFLLWSAKGKRERLSYLAVLLVLVCVWAAVLLFLSSQSSANEKGTALSVAAVSTQVPDVLYPTPEQQRAWFEDEAASVEKIRGTDLVALPEGSGFLEYLYHSPGSSARNAFANAGMDSPPLVIDSVSLREADGKLYSRTEYYDAATGQSAFAYKRYLMPFGEQLPYFYRSVSFLMGKWDIIQSILGSRAFSFKGVTPSVSVRGVPISALLCSEAMAPTFYRDEVRRGAQVLVNLSSHAWFHGSYPLYIHLLRVDAVRAAENKRWLVQAGNIVPSFILDPYGRVVAASEWGSTGVLRSVVYARTDRTPFNILGVWVLVFPIALLAWCIWRRR